MSGSKNTKKGNAHYSAHYHEIIREGNQEEQPAAMISLPPVTTGLPLPQREGCVYRLHDLRREDREDYSEEEDPTVSQPNKPFFLDSLIRDLIDRQRLHDDFDSKALKRQKHL